MIGNIIVFIIVISSIYCIYKFPLELGYLVSKHFRKETPEEIQILKKSDIWGDGFVAIILLLLCLCVLFLTGTVVYVFVMIIIDTLSHLSNYINSL